MNLSTIVAQNEVAPLPHDGKEKQEFDALANMIDGNAINWAVLANDATILRAYGMLEHEAIGKVFDAFRRDFVNRLHAELKARKTAQWKAETFEKLKKEFAQE
jgi:hypothetical protein